MSASVNPSLRAWQLAALEAWKPSRRGIIEVVTGGGKTRFALEVIRDTWRSSADVRVMVVVPSVALQDQWVVEIETQLGVVAGTLRRDVSAGRRIVVLVINTARTLVSEIDDPEMWLQIVDECHRIGSPENRLALMRTSWGTLGLSATPDRQYDDYLDQYVVPALGPIILRYGYAAAIRDGVITQFELCNVEVWVTEPETQQLARLAGRIARAMSRWGPEDDRTRAALLARARYVQGIKSRVPSAVQLVLEEPTTPTIVFHESTAGADLIASSLTERGVAVGVYHSKVSVAARRRDLRLFSIGALDILICCRALDEGLNVPRAARAIIAASTASTRQRIQRLGRIVRPHGSKSTPSVVTLWATESEAQRLVEEAEMLDGLASVRWLRAEAA